ncbi:MAG TPA: molybdopterin-dependent oxidoreductase, partial [Beijerinckiaceae bacterium]|nr:molybdopterin-dependent oxidoreductase [Beijerinckiaceae bacterium]
MRRRSEIDPEAMARAANPARIRKAPENFLGAEEIAAVSGGRRDFLRGAFAAAAALGAGAAAAQDAPKGDEMILKPQSWATTLGQPVAATPYGMPSKYEGGLIRRQSPGLTQVAGASVSFMPLQGMFGIITPSGLHFERHHQGWYDIDPNKHRFMINGSTPEFVKKAKVYTLDDLMRFPSVSRMHFIECGANTGMEWGNVA